MDVTTRIRRWLAGVFFPDRQLRRQYRLFKELLRHDQKCLELLTSLEELGTGPPVDWAKVEALSASLSQAVADLIQALQALHPGRYAKLTKRFEQIAAALHQALSLPTVAASPPYTLTLPEAASQPALAGGKAWALARVGADAALPTPRGFVITTRAYALFLEHNALRPRLNRLLAEVTLDDWEELNHLTEEMAALVRQGELPPVLVAEIDQRLQELAQQGTAGPWIVRSSAVSEDGELSFAGQYRSVPHVASADVSHAYKEVLASKYSARAVSYRMRQGLLDQETPMAVLVLEMIEALTSGVMYTRGLKGQKENLRSLVIFAICGNCQHLVDGTVVPEILYVNRDSQPYPTKPWEGQGSCLLPIVAEKLAVWGQRLEELFGAPQDIEWCQDKRGECYILQSRPLHDHDAEAVRDGGEIHSWQEDFPLLVSGGVTASPGLGVGRVYVLKSETDLGQVPGGAVLVTSTLSPALAGIIDRLRAVVAERGSPASHFASVAREFGLPVLCGVSHATHLLAPNTAVVVDAVGGRVYQGEGHVASSLRSHTWFSGSSFQNHLQRVLAVISPLQLLDPQSPAFVPENCQSLHDLIRFCHEKGMTEMFALGGRSGRGLGEARQLLTNLPLTLYVLELESCLSPQTGKNKTVRLQDIHCPPFQACWAGLTHPDIIWHQGLKYLDWERLDQISGGLVSLKSAGLASYALLAPDYAHILLRFGYHFAVLDTLCSDRAEANYIAFRFKGGGGHYENRLRRLRFIENILLWAGFQVKTEGDLLEARFDRQPEEIILSRLQLWGILQGKCQLLDMSLPDEAAVAALVTSFQERYGQLLN